MFVYDRVDNTSQTLNALLANTLALDTDLYVFSDGGRDTRSWANVRAVRSLLHSVKAEAEANGLLHSMTIIERTENYYIERNIMEGVSMVFKEHDRIIVLEDDIVTGPYYLKYMNEAFEMYEPVPCVMHISGFTNLCLPEGVDGREFYFTPHMSGWGWGTWRDRWQKWFRNYANREEALEGLSEAEQDAMQYGGVFPCLRSLDRTPIPWDICWEIAIWRAKGLCLTPAQTMVRNVGLGKGTHFHSISILQSYEYDRPPLQRPLQLELVGNPEANPETERLFAEAITDWGIRYTPLGKVARRIYKRLKG